MDNYYIFTLSSGQPIILYQESEKIYMYAIYSGRIRSYGVVLEDVKDHFQHFFSNHHYVWYFSTQDKLRLFSLKDFHFNELLSLPSKENQTTRILQGELISHQNTDYLLYLIHEPTGHSKLYATSLADLATSVVLFESNLTVHHFYITSSEQGMFLQLIFENDSKLIRLNSLNATGDFKILSDSGQNNKELKEKIAKLEVTLYEKSNRIASLESTQKHITEQYNELADFAGRLQEELRKARYL